MQIGHLAGQPIDGARSPYVGERECLEIGEAGGPLERVAVARHLGPIAPAPVPGDLRRRADPGVPGVGQCPPPELQLLRRDGEVDEEDVDQVVVP
jgi:hypothetical protein